ncbi:hypothetical protein L4D09_27545 [Photobacterium makurazakiensis]|uniref:DUF6789 family protein n=1 Tax=Photobacterium makurazakiensis TaxID=2910234 RepID=UPI003D110FDA
MCIYRKKSQRSFGIEAGVFATFILSMIMAVKINLNILPELNPIEILNSVIPFKEQFKLKPTAGWAIHIFLGVVIWGTAYEKLISVFPAKSYVIKAIIFSIAAWLLMMLILMPLAGHSLFGLGLGVGVKAGVVTLFFHIIYGLSLGFSYKKLSKKLDKS